MGTRKRAGRSKTTPKTRAILPRNTSAKGLPKRNATSDQSAGARGPAAPVAHNSNRRRVVALLGFLQKAEVDQLFRQQPFQTSTQEDPLEMWRRFDAARVNLAPIPEGQVVAAPDAAAPFITALKQRPSYIEHYERVADYRIASVPIESLLAPQWYADLDYIDEIARSLSGQDSLEAQLRFAFSEGKISEPIVSGNTVLFSSPRRDLHVDPVPRLQQTAEGEIVIYVRAMSRPNYIQIAEIGSRLFLVNGVHKVCALYRAGFTHCYCAVRQAHDVATTGLNPQSISMLRPPVFDGLRPAAVVDFLNPDTAAPLTLRSMNQVLQVVIQSGILTVPALPQ